MIMLDPSSALRSLPTAEINERNAGEYRASFRKRSSLRMTTIVTA